MEPISIPKWHFCSFASIQTHYRWEWLLGIFRLLFAWLLNGQISGCFSHSWVWVQFVLPTQSPGVRGVSETCRVNPCLADQILCLRVSGSPLNCCSENKGNHFSSDWFLWSLFPLLMSSPICSPHRALPPQAHPAGWSTSQHHSSGGQWRPVPLQGLQRCPTSYPVAQTHWKKWQPLWCGRDTLRSSSQGWWLTSEEKMKMKKFQNNCCLPSVCFCFFENKKREDWEGIGF